MTETLQSEQDPQVAQPQGHWFSPENRLLALSAFALMGVLIVWGMYTPGGLLGKADAVGYAICHRIEVRSFLFPNGRPLPMCARCSGTFLGVLIGILGPGLIFRRRKPVLMPPVGILAVMITMSFIWAFDGTNSFSYLLPFENIPRLYSPSNFLRVVTGMFHGITLGNLILPVMNSTVWANYEETRSVKNLWELLALYGIGVVVIGLILTGQGIFLYPLAVLSAAGTVMVLAMVNTVMAATVLKRINRAMTFREAMPLFLLGLAMTFVFLGAIDFVRYAYFGTWDGITAFPNA